MSVSQEVENFPGFPEGIMGGELTEKFRKQSAHFGARLLEETVETVDLSKRPFEIKTDRTHITADAVIIATGAVAKRMDFPGSGEGPGGFWNKGISACAVCDGAAPIFRNRHLAVVGGGDSALEEAMFLTKYASKVTIVHRRDELRASKIMQSRAKANPKIAFAFNSVPVQAYGEKLLQGIKLESTVDKTVTDLPVNGLFFGIGHKPATDFLGGQVALDDQGYIVTEPGTTKTSVPGVFAAGDVQDKRYRQAITAAGSGCMAALDVEHFLTTLE
jgi:thioredoxin reductase (NADPH)